MRHANWTRKCAAPWCSSAAWAGLAHCLACQWDIDIRNQIAALLEDDYRASTIYGLPLETADGIPYQMSPP